MIFKINIYWTDTCNDSNFVIFTNLHWVNGNYTGTNDAIDNYRVHMHWSWV